LNSHTLARKQQFAEISKVLQTQLGKKKSEQLRHDLDARLRKSAKIEVVSN